MTKADLRERLSRLTFPADYRHKAGWDLSIGTWYDFYNRCIDEAGSNFSKVHLRQLKINIAKGRCGYEKD